MVTNSEPRRVLLWAAPRTLSTAFLKCMSFVDGVQIVNEPYASAFSFGPDKKTMPDTEYQNMQGSIEEEIKDQEDEINMPLGFDAAICSYDWVKETLEADYPGKKLVFCKYMVYALDGKYHAIPRGFKHTFIIRDPIKIFYSLRKRYLQAMAIPKEQQDAFRLTELPPEIFQSKYQFGEMVDLMHHLKDNNIESNPIVIDADDLQAHPESILRQYFEALKIPFNQSLLKWEAGDEVIKSWIGATIIVKMNQLDRGGYYSRALSSSGFLPSTPVPDKSQLTPDVIKCAEESQKYYKDLYNMRIKP